MVEVSRSKAPNGFPSEVDSSGATCDKCCTINEKHNEAKNGTPVMYTAKVKSLPEPEKLKAQVVLSSFCCCCVIWQRVCDGRGTDGSFLAPRLSN